MSLLTQNNFLTSPYVITKNVMGMCIDTFRLKDRYVRKTDGGFRLRFLSSLLILTSAPALQLTQISSSGLAGFSAITTAFQNYNSNLVKMARTELAAIEPAAASHNFDDPKLQLDRTRPVYIEKNGHSFKTAAYQDLSGLNGFSKHAPLKNGIVKAALTTPETSTSTTKQGFHPRTVSINIETGDTLANVLKRHNFRSSDIHGMIKAMSAYHDPRLIRPGQDIQLSFNTKGEFESLNIVKDPIRTVKVASISDGHFSATLVEKEIDNAEKATRIEIKNSLYGSALKHDIPEPIIHEVIKILSYSVDLQREIQRGDELEILYTVQETEDGLYVKSGTPQYVRLNQKNKDYAFYRYEDRHGKVDYYNKDGKGAKKALLRTPVNGARISSGYGMRKHPILGYSKMHKGVDFAAPTGTPIYAAGDGVIERADTFGTYGKYIRVRHKNAIKTAYAHLHKIPSNIKPGVFVEQGQMIGYVGNTGRSTGPHLHYEVIKNGQQINPKKIQTTTLALEGSELEVFKSRVKHTQQAYASLVKDPIKVASNTSEPVSSPSNAN